MGIEAAVTIVRECMPVDAVLGAAASAVPAGEVIVLIGDESALPDSAATRLGSITTASLWAPADVDGAFQRFLLELSRRAVFGACGITLADHSCASRYLFAERGDVSASGTSEGDDYLQLPVTAIEECFSVSLGLTSEESLVLTECLMSPSSGFRLVDGEQAEQLTENDATAVQEADGRFAEFECVLDL